MKSWLVGGFNTNVINRVMGIANSGKVSPDKLTIYVTGVHPAMLANTIQAQGMQCMLVLV